MEKLSAQTVVNGQVVRDVEKNMQQIVLHNFVTTEVSKDVAEESSKGVMVQVMEQNGVLNEEVVVNVQCNETEGEEFRCNGVRCSPVLHEMMVSPVVLGSPILTSNLVSPQSTSRHAEVVGLPQDEEDQGVVFVQDLVSDREEGEILLVLGTKGYESDVEMNQNSGTPKALRGKVVRKSQRVPTRSHKFNL